MRIMGVERINVIIRILLKEQLNTNEFKDITYINYGLNLISKNGLKIFLKSFIKRKKIIVHWIGSDVYTLLGTDRKNRLKSKLLWIMSKTSIVYNWSAAPLLQEELKSLGVNSEIVVVPSELVKEVSIKPLPSTFEFLTYLPESNHSFYNSDLILQFARKNPDIKIHIVANDGKGMPKYPNVIYHGYVAEKEMDKLYVNTRGVIRLPIHDALGGTVLEAVNRGRYAIWTYKASYVYTCTTYEDLEKAVADICEKTTPNHEGAEYVKKHFNYNLLQKNFLEMLRNVNNN